MKSSRLLLLLVVGCASVPAGPHWVDGPQGRSRLFLPQGWYAAPTSIPHALLFRSDLEDAFIMISSIEKEPGMTLREYGAVAQTRLLMGLDEPEIEHSEAVSQNNLEGVGIALVGKSSGQTLSYLHFSFEGPLYFHQLMGWSTAGRFLIYRMDLIEAFASFEELEPVPEAEEVEPERERTNLLTDPNAA